MHHQKASLIIASIVTLTLSACATIEDKLIESGATRLNAEQAKTHIVGNTEKWSKGGAYYNPNGTLETLWDGNTHRGPYSIAADGNVCYEVLDWGRLCHFYMNDNGTITMIYKKRNVGVHDVLNGNQLSSL